MLQYPNINPVALEVGKFKIHWYGLMYLVSFLGVWGLALFRRNKLKLHWSNEDISDLVFYGALGVIIGGRLGYVLIYDNVALLNNPLMLFRIWEGGMSFHGGLIGVLLTLRWFAYKKQWLYLMIMDFIAPLVPVGLAAGRLGNFINGELWGRITTVPWAMVFPRAGNAPRHPSQLYEFTLEGLVLFTILWCYTRKPHEPGRASAVFLISYGLLRIFAEQFRQPDVQMGFIGIHGLTMGQVLSLPMILFGIGLWWYSRAQSSSKIMSGE